MANDKNIVYGECYLGGEEGSWTITDAQKAVYDALRKSDAELEEWEQAFPDFNHAQIAFLYAGICPKHAELLWKKSED